MQLSCEEPASQEGRVGSASNNQDESCKQNHAPHLQLGRAANASSFAIRATPVQLPNRSGQFWMAMPDRRITRDSSRCETVPHGWQPACRQQSSNCCVTRLFPGQFAHGIVLDSVRTSWHVLTVLQHCYQHSICACSTTRLAASMRCMRQQRGSKIPQKPAQAHGMKFQSSRLPRL